MINLPEIREWTMLALEASIVFILILEYVYDKEVEESKQKKRKVSKKKVSIVIDNEGNARIDEAPKDLDVQIKHEGK